MSNDLDFEAWEAPPPPDGLADAVIARMGGTAVGLAMPDAPRRRRWVIAASAATALVVAGGVWAIVHGRERAPAQNGAVIADRAEHVELPGATAELDRGADIHWHRTSDGLDIEQRAGTAVWRVGKDEKIIIGAAVASIEAAGASLRVEVPMNMPVSKSDARMIGASALTAATVALVTVVVYEGHVKVSHSGQTVVVQPGTTYTVPRPTPVPTVSSGQVTLDDTPNGDALEKILAPHDGELAACLGKDVDDVTLLYTLDVDGSVSSDEVDRDDSSDDAASCMMNVLQTLTFPASKHGGKFAHTVKRASCDADALVAAGTQATANSQPADALVKYEAAIACKPEKRFYQLAFMASCNAKNVTKASEYYGKLTQEAQNRMLQMCVRNGITREQLEPASCDANDLQQKGMAQEQIGQHTGALASFEQAIRCQPSTRLYQLAFMASCNAKSVSKSQFYWNRLPAGTRDQLKQICMRNGILPETLDGLAGPTPDLASGQGQVRIDSIPQANVLFDGVESGTTPVLLKATPGKHKVTFVVGQDRFTYPVTVKAGETETLSKHLQ